MNTEKLWLIFLCVCLSFSSCNQATKPTSTKTDFNPELRSGLKGLHGYIAYDSPKPPAQYGAGVAFYSAVWPLIRQPIKDFQIGLPGTWITPDNSDNKDIPLCPVGTYARDNWPERAPTYSAVFQTLEGGLGYWAGNRFRYGPPKFSMNATSSCYDFEIASPGWSFFYDKEALPDNKLGIAQLHNSLLIPPDGLTFEGNPNGRFLGYSYMALPFTDPIEGPTPTGDQSWTCFLNAGNFKGPIAYYLPETWSKISRNYPIINGRGLDAKPGLIRGGAMEINTVPHFEAKDAKGELYIKIPQLYFPVNKNKETPLVQDLTFYSKDGLFSQLKKWRDDGLACDGSFNAAASWKPSLSTRPPKYDQGGIEIDGVNEIFETIILDQNVFGLKWSPNSISNEGKFPQYFKQKGDKRIPIPASSVPKETQLLDKTFPLAEKQAPYSSPTTGAWNNPGPVSGPHTVRLADGSKVTYSWYRFVDQPTFQQFSWSTEQKEKLQSFIEKIHANWTTDKDYMPPPSTGKLASLDPALIVIPPNGLEQGYVPIVTQQER